MLAAIMMMAMSVTAFAAEGATGTLTLTVNVKSTTPAQDLNGQTINLYKLFDVTESGTTGSKNYAYTVNTETGYKDALVSVLTEAGKQLQRDLKMKSLQQLFLISVSTILQKYRTLQISLQHMR